MRAQVWAHEAKKMRAQMFLNWMAPYVHIYIASNNKNNTFSAMDKYLFIIQNCHNPNSDKAKATMEITANCVAVTFAKQNVLEFSYVVWGFQS